jgi:hypothetical protein
MSKEKVFIVVSHTNALKEGSRDEWQVHEKVEFVNQLKKRHTDTASAIGDYLNRKIVKGAFYGFDEYDKLENYIRSKYKEQMTRLDSFYRPAALMPVENTTPIAVGSDGVITVAD